MIRRISFCCVSDANFLTDNLWIMYYSPEKDVIYAISPQMKPIFDSLIIWGLRSNTDLLDIQYYLANKLKFILQYPERNTYMNAEGTCLQLTSNNTIFIALEEKDQDAKEASIKKQVTKFFINLVKNGFWYAKNNLKLQY